MVIAALVTFAILLVAWIVAPSGIRRPEPEPEVTTPEIVEPIAA